MTVALPGREPDLVLGPLALVAAALLVRGVRRRKAVPLVAAAAALGAELGWPAYGQFKRRPGVPTVLARYPDAEPSRRRREPVA
jgi:hypothetical protein